MDAHLGAVDVELAARGVAFDLTCDDIGIAAQRICHDGDAAADFAQPAPAVRVVDVEHRGLGHRKEPMLRRRIRFKRLMKVEMVARDVRQRGDTKAHIFDAIERERVRADLHRDRPCAELMHLGEERMQIGR